MGSEKDNFFRFICLITEVVAEVFRCRLKQSYKNSHVKSLPSFLKDTGVLHTIFHLFFPRQLCCWKGCRTQSSNVSIKQWNILYDSDPSRCCNQNQKDPSKICLCCVSPKNVDESDLDLSLLSLILINCCNLMPNEAEAVHRLRDMKNVFFSHNRNCSLSQLDFESLLENTKIYTQHLDSTNIYLKNHLNVLNRPLDESLMQKYFMYGLESMSMEQVRNEQMKRVHENLIEAVKELKSSFRHHQRDEVEHGIKTKRKRQEMSECFDAPNEQDDGDDCISTKIKVQKLMKLSGNTDERIYKQPDTKPFDLNREFISSKLFGSDVPTAINLQMDYTVFTMKDLSKQPGFKEMDKFICGKCSWLFTSLDQFMQHKVECINKQKENELVKNEYKNYINSRITIPTKDQDLSHKIVRDWQQGNLDPKHNSMEVEYVTEGCVVIWIKVDVLLFLDSKHFYSALDDLVNDIFQKYAAKSPFYRVQIFDLATGYVDHNADEFCCGDCKLKCNTLDKFISHKNEKCFQHLHTEGRTGLWKNDSYIEACGDILISASKIKQLGGQGRVLKAMAGSIRLTEDSPEVQNLESNHLHVDVSQEAILQSVKTDREAVAQGNIATIQNINSKMLQVKAQQKVQIKTANILHDMSVISKRIAAGNVKSKHFDLKASENITLDNVSTKEIANLESGNTIDANNIKVTDLNTISKGRTDLGVIQAEQINEVSKCGNITLNEKSEAKDAKLETKHRDISLTSYNKKADHKFGCLNMTTRALDDINQLLNRSDVYKDLKIADHLGLIVEDKNVIIATQQKSQFSASIKAASINVRKGMGANNLELTTTKGILKNDENVKIKAKENVRLTSGEKHQLCEMSSLGAVQKINLESETNSVSLSANKLDAGSCITIKPYHDITISSNANEGPCKKSKLSAGRTNKEQSAIDIEAERNIKIHASDIKSKGENTFKAGNNISITANKYDTTKSKRKSSWVELCRRPIETNMTHVEKPTIAGRLNVFKAGESFTSVSRNDIRAIGGISMLGFQTTTKTKKTSSIFGIKYYQKDESSQHLQRTSLEDSSTEARTSIKSETSNIGWLGSDLRSADNVSDIAEMRKITHSRRLLNHETKEIGIKVNIQKSTKDTEGNFGIEAIYKHESNQTTSTDSTEIGGDYTLKAMKLNILNADNIDVTGNMNVKTDDLRIEGASLEACDKRVNIGIGVESNIATVSANYEKGEITTQQMQKLHVDGTLHLDNIKHVTIDTSNIDSGGLTGQVDNLDIKSRSDRKSRVKLGVTADTDLVTRSLCGRGIDIGLEGDDRNTPPTSIDVNGGSKELSVGTLETKGATMVFDGDVHKCA